MMKMLKLASLLLILANVPAAACATGKSPAATAEKFRAEVTVKKDGAKPVAEFMFYRPISEIVNGRENEDFGRLPIVVDFPQLDGAPLRETEAPNGRKTYLAELETAAKEYVVTFRRKDGEYRAVVRIDPDEAAPPLNPEFRKTEH